MRRGKRKIISLTVGVLIIFSIVFFIFINPRIQAQRAYTADELGIKVVTSSKDKDADGIDDYTDIMLGAREYIATNPTYESRYYDGGYPNDGYGVCADVVWSAFKNAGYNLKDLMDKDISKNLKAYTTIDKPDPNIDFRRVRNLKIFFERNAKVLPTDFSNKEDWQAGDIVIYSNHIVICSDKRNADGIPFIIHLPESGVREANDLAGNTIEGHYRWDG
jgi:uncharacterized protein YijF (DUF1287 family)